MCVQRALFVPSLGRALSKTRLWYPSPPALGSSRNTQQYTHLVLQSPADVAEGAQALPLVQGAQAPHNLSASYNFNPISQYFSQSAPDFPLLSNSYSFSRDSSVLSAKCQRLPESEHEQQEAFPIPGVPPALMKLQAHDRSSKKLKENGTSYLLTFLGTLDKPFNTQFLQSFQPWRKTVWSLPTPKHFALSAVLPEEEQIEKSEPPNRALPWASGLQFTVRG